MLFRTRTTERVRRVIEHAQREATRSAQPDIGPEHLLLGLIHERDSVGARLLERLGVRLRDLCHDVENRAAPSEVCASKGTALNPDGHRVLRFAAEESRRLENGYLGTEHLLLALLRIEDGTAAKALADAGVTLEAARAEVEALQDGGE